MYTIYKYKLNKIFTFSFGDFKGEFEHKTVRNLTH